MDLTIEVERVQGAWFEPFMKDYINTEEGRATVVFFFHWDDITDEGCVAFADVFTQQALRWKPRTPEAPRGERIPIWMELRTDMEPGCAIVVDDRPEYIRYIVRAGLIEQRAADAITRSQSERSPDWVRLPARYAAQLRAV
ncbi:hypothetical protein AB0F46_29320 [Streptomyces sp. NPDC026665]|uniref:hypothetical protein n=1 Tax=Streptomyces sp. NPDC026665 TaxID=3154798 RepID=UPI0033E3FB2D